jgi:hypothetical protein
VSEARVARTAREDLAAAQAALVTALLAEGTAPPGFDPVRLGRQAAALRARRRRLVAAADPELVVRLGEQAFADSFDAWARAHPPRVGGCPHADAAAFAGSLGRGSLLRKRRRRVIRSRAL